MLTRSRRQWQGLERQLLGKLRNAIGSMQKRDERVFERSQILGVEGYFFAANEADPVFLAMQTLMTRINACLNARS